MATYQGVVTKTDLEGGIWVLQTDDGQRYQLRGGANGLRKQGLRVAIDGSIDRAAVGIGMTGPYLDVASWRER